MSEHIAEVEWSRDGASFDVDYDRNHTWSFDGGVTVPASAAPGLSGDGSRVDPEEAFVASISSCHMLWFLYLAAEAGWTVDRYHDRPVGVMGRDASQGGPRVTWITDVTLHPTIEFAGDGPSAAQLEELHDESHRRCFIANSVRSRITVAAP